MNEIKSIGMTICIMMVLMAYLKQAIPKGKTTYLMKAIISVFILLSVVNGIRTFDFHSVKEFLNRPYTNNEEVWKNAAEMVADGLMSEFQNYLSKENISAEVQGVTVEVNEDRFVIKKVIVSGTDAENARNLLAGRYQIGIAYIEVKNE